MFAAGLLNVQRHRVGVGRRDGAGEAVIVRDADAGPRDIRPAAHQRVPEHALRDFDLRRAGTGVKVQQCLLGRHPAQQVAVAPAGVGVPRDDLQLGGREPLRGLSSMGLGLPGGEHCERQRMAAVRADGLQRADAHAPGSGSRDCADAPAAAQAKACRARASRLNRGRLPSEPPSSRASRAPARQRSNFCTETPTSVDTTPTLALSGGNRRATKLCLNASAHRAIALPDRPQVRDHIGATTIVTVLH